MYKENVIDFLCFSFTPPLPNTHKVTNDNNLVCIIPFFALI